MLPKGKTAMDSTPVSAWMGIDVSKRSLDACLLEGESKERSRKFSNDAKGWNELLEWLGGIPAQGVHFVMESTGAYSFGPASFLADKGLLVSLENPRFVKRWAEGTRHQNKTDRADARILARYARAVSPSPWSLSDPSLRELELLLGRIAELEKLERMELNRLENTSLPQSVASSIRRSASSLAGEAEAMREALEERLKTLPEVRTMVAALVKEPGVGELTALRLLAHFGWGTERFESAQQAAAAAGYNPVKRESGQWKGVTRISKCGPPELRGALHMAVVAAVQFNPVLKAFYERLLAKGMSKLAALTACARKLVMRLFGILKAHRRGETPAYAAEKSRFTDLRGKQKAFPKPEKKTEPLTR
jgi:transposase